jgi:hypothetical protein
MRIYNGESGKGRTIERDIHMYHCGLRQEALKNMTNAQAKRLRHRERFEGRRQARAEA